MDRSLTSCAPSRYSGKATTSKIPSQIASSHLTSNCDTTKESTSESTYRVGWNTYLRWEILDQQIYDLYRWHVLQRYDHSVNALAHVNSISCRRPSSLVWPIWDTDSQFHPFLPFLNLSILHWIRARNAGAVRFPGYSAIGDKNRSYIYYRRARNLKELVFPTSTTLIFKCFMIWISGWQSQMVYWHEFYIKVHRECEAEPYCSYLCETNNYIHIRSCV